HRQHEGREREPRTARGAACGAGWGSMSCRHVGASRTAWPGPHALHTRQAPDRAPARSWHAPRPDRREEGPDETALPRRPPGDHPASFELGANELAITATSSAPDAPPRAAGPPCIRVRAWWIRRLVATVASATPRRRSGAECTEIPALR